MTLLASRRQAAEHAIKLLRQCAADAPRPTSGAAAAERRYNSAALEAMVLTVADMLDLDTEPSAVIQAVQRVAANQLSSCAMTAAAGDVDKSISLLRTMLRSIEAIAVDQIRHPPEGGVIEYRGPAHMAGHA